MSEKRFQECGRLEQIWRGRWFLLVPFMALRMFIRNALLLKTPLSRGEWRFCWYCSLGIIDMKVEWWYTTEEIAERIRSKTKR